MEEDLGAFAVPGRDNPKAAKNKEKMAVFKSLKGRPLDFILRTQRNCVKDLEDSCKEALAPFRHGPDIKEVLEKTFNLKGIEEEKHAWAYVVGVPRDKDVWDKCGEAFTKVASHTENLTRLYQTLNEGLLLQPYCDCLLYTSPSPRDS